MNRSLEKNRGPNEREESKHLLFFLCLFMLVLLIMFVKCISIILMMEY